ncbi:hypothetical protein BASA81_003606 [Batrachochytrium salamandrivorans]|nr:hypothetical protein BASA81_003606 [Batrachochytrium salamandrivorans]
MSVLPPHAVNIIKIVDGRVCVDEPALRSILLAIPADVQISIVSVVGAFRTGKSFLLNFFLKYLSCSGEQVGDWMSDYIPANQNANQAQQQQQQQSQAQEGFHWRGGAETCTLGIWMWSQHFLRTTPQGELVAVLLMDTQGLFDGTLTQQLTTAVFGLSTLISSHQIFNVKEKIQDDHLQHLALFSEYSKLVAKSGSKWKSFQRLEFLIRDYGDFDGDVTRDEVAQYIANLSNEYLAKVFAQDANEEVKLVRAQIKSVFDDLQCFILPHPGTHVPHTKFDGSVSKLSSEFRLALEAYVPRVFLFAGSNDVKQLHGHPVQGGAELFELIAAYCHVFQGDELPQAQSLYETTVHANNQSVLRKAKLLYSGEMQRRTFPKLLSPKDLLREHLEAKLASTVLLAKWEMGSETTVSQFHLALDAELEQAFANLCVANELRHREEKETIGNAQFNVEAMYSQGLQPFELGLWEDNDISDRGNELLEIAMMEFKRQAQGCDFYFTQYLQQLEHRLATKLESSLLDNAKRHDQERQVLGGLIHAIDLFTRKATISKHTLTFRDLLELAVDNAYNVLRLNLQLKRDLELEILNKLASELLLEADLHVIELESKVWKPQDLQRKLDSIVRDCQSAFAKRSMGCDFHSKAVRTNLIQGLSERVIKAVEQNHTRVNELLEIECQKASEGYVQFMRALVNEGKILLPKVLNNAHVAQAEQAHRLLTERTEEFCAWELAPLPHAKLGSIITSEFALLHAANQQRLQASKHENWPVWGLNLLPIVGTVKNGFQALQLAKQGRTAEARGKTVETTISLLLDLITVGALVLSSSPPSPTGADAAKEATGLAGMRLAGTLVGEKTAQELFSKQTGKVAYTEQELEGLEEAKLLELLLSSLSSGEDTNTAAVLRALLQRELLTHDELVGKAAVAVLARFGKYDYAMTNLACQLLGGLGKQNSAIVVALGGKSAIYASLPTESTALALKWLE